MRFVVLAPGGRHLLVRGGHGLLRVGDGGSFSLTTPSAAA